MKAETYWILKAQVARSPYADDISWAEQIQPPETALEFFCEYTFVVINSGMKAQIARVIYNKVMDTVLIGKGSASLVFGHKGKCAAIDKIFADRYNVFNGWLSAKDPLEYLAQLPWIGPITKYHLAKNFGMDVVKPDRHLVRIAEKSGETPDQLCRRLSLETLDKVAVVDTVIWRAANMGLV